MATKPLACRGISSTKKQPVGSQVKAPKSTGALVVLSLGALLINLDSTIVNVALPSIREDLGFSDASLAWVVNVYLLVYGACLVPMGRVGDLFGRRRMFLLGIGLFTLASLACGTAESQELLVASRALQGVGAAVISAVVLCLAMDLFTRASVRARAIGVIGFIGTSGGSMGLLAGGTLTSALNWHWVFLVNLPIGVTVCILGNAWLPPDTARTSRTRLGPGAQTQLIPLVVLQSRNLLVANMVATLWAAALLSWMFTSTLYLQFVLGYGPLQVALAFLPANVAGGALSVGASAALIKHFGVKPPLTGGLLLAAIGIALFGRAPLNGTLSVDVLPGMLLLGVGSGLLTSPLLLAAMSGVAPAEFGTASGVINTALMMGGAIGLWTLITIAAARTHDLLGTGLGSPAAHNGGYHVVFYICAALTAVAACLCGMLLRDDKRTTVPGHREAASRRQ